MRNKLWNIWCHAVVACYGMTVVRPRLAAAACLVGAFVVIALMDVPVTNSGQLPVAGGPASTAPQSEATSHGPTLSLHLALPELPSSTHMEQAEALAVKLVAGFGVKLPVALEFSDWILEASARQRMEPELIASLVFAESSFRKYAQSHVGAVGPAQVRPHYWGAFCGHADLNDPEENIYCGTQVLGYLLERCEGDQRCALSAYNIGMNSKRFAAGLRYIDKIDRHMQTLKTVSL
jgi:hypothetical protein